MAAQTTYGIPSYGLLNTALVLEDNEQLVGELFPVILSLVCIAAIATIGVAFGYIAAPVRILTTIIIPILFVYALTALVYVKGVLRWTGIPALQEISGGIFFGALPFTCTPLIGLSFDYDIFLFSRISELRFAGMSNRDAVKEGLIQTGPTINIAGFAMAMAMGSMLFSDIPLTNQIGFMMCAGVLIDTFLVRTFLVPAFLLLIGDWAYWPCKPPEANENKDLQKALLDGL